jgi:hypothetical protein
VKFEVISGVNSLRQNFVLSRQEHAHQVTQKHNLEIHLTMIQLHKTEQSITVLCGCQAAVGQHL